MHDFNSFHQSSSDRTKISAQYEATPGFRGYRTWHMPRLFDVTSEASAKTICCDKYISAMSVHHDFAVILEHYVNRNTALMFTIYKYSVERLGPWLGPCVTISVDRRNKRLSGGLKWSGLIGGSHQKSERLITAGGNPARLRFAVGVAIVRLNAEGSEKVRFP